MSDPIDASATLASKLNALLVRLGHGNLKDGSLVRLTAGAQLLRDCGEKSLPRT
jgi:hypothetical protein